MPVAYSNYGEDAKLLLSDIIYTINIPYPVNCPPFVKYTNIIYTDIY